MNNSSRSDLYTRCSYSQSSGRHRCDEGLSLPSFRALRGPGGASCPASPRLRVCGPSRRQECPFLLRVPRALLPTALSPQKGLCCSSQVDTYPSPMHVGSPCSPPLPASAVRCHPLVTAAAPEPAGPSGSSGQLSLTPLVSVTTPEDSQLVGASVAWETVFLKAPY